VIFHFNEDGVGSVDVPASKLHSPANITIMDKYVKISVVAPQQSYVGTLEGRRMNCRWTGPGGKSEDLVLIKD
jgi:hypothetical protein